MVDGDSAGEVGKRMRSTDGILPVTMLWVDLNGISVES